MPIVMDLEQRSPEWLQMHIGMVTASRVADCQSFLTRKSPNGEKGDETARRIGYKRDLVSECLTGLMPDSFVSDAMKWGIDNEPLARASYETRYKNADVQPIGFAIHDKIDRFGASPDSLVGEDGLLEIKCLNTENHIDILLSGQIPDVYQPQMLAEMACTNRQWVDFCSFDPRIKEKRLRLFVKRFHRDEKAISEMEQAVEKFLSEVDDLLARLKQDDPASLEFQLRKSIEQASSV